MDKHRATAHHKKTKKETYARTLCLPKQHVQYRSAQFMLPVMARWKRSRTCGAFFDLMTRENLVQDTIYTIFPKGWVNSPFRFEMHAYKHPSVHKDISNTDIGIVHERSHSRV